jgi:hypothetical protein
MLEQTPVLRIALLVFLAGVATGWVLRSSARQPAASDGWLSGSVDEKFAAVERHLRGLDQTMAEIGYRFTELYWAGKDRSWVYARYQFDKIETTLKLGFERRPRRAVSAAPFLAEENPAMRQAIERENDANDCRRFASFAEREESSPATATSADRRERVRALTPPGAIG